MEGTATTSSDGTPIVPEFNGWLEELVAGEGSDLHVKVGSAPMIRLPKGLYAARPRPAHGHRDPGDRRRHHPRGPQAEVQRHRRGRLRLLDPQRRPVPRQRLPSARLDQHGAAQAPLRRALVRGDRPARRRAHDRRRAPRPDPGDRPDGLGQDDDARGHDRLHQQDQARAHRDRRGSDRGAAPRRDGVDQPAGDRQRHDGLPRRPARGPAPGPRRDPDRRDA